MLRLGLAVKMWTENLHSWKEHPGLQMDCMGELLLVCVGHLLHAALSMMAHARVCHPAQHLQWQQPHVCWNDVLVTQKPTALPSVACAAEAVVRTEG